MPDTDRLLMSQLLNQAFDETTGALKTAATSKVNAAVEGQRFFLSSTGQLALAVAGNLRITVTNPANSGRNLLLTRLVGFATSRAFATIFVNPTAGVPATAVRPRTNAIVGGPEGSGELRVDTSATTPLSGGTATGLVLALGADRRELVDLPPLVLAPGVVMGVNVPFSGAADAVVSCYWFEEVL